MKIDFKNILSELNKEKSLEKQIEIHSRLVLIIRRKFNQTIQNIPIAKSFTSLNHGLSNFSSWCVKQLKFIETLISSEPYEENLIRSIETNLINHKSRIDVIIIKDISYSSLVSKIESLSRPSIVVYNKIKTENVIDFEPKEDKFIQAPITSSTLKINFNYYELNLSSDYNRYLYYRFEYLKSYSLWVFEQIYYHSEKKKNDYSYLLFLLKIISNKLKSLNTSSIEHINTIGIKNSNVRYNHTIEPTNDLFKKISIEIITDFQLFFNSPLTSEISMIEQLREHFIVNQNILLKSKPFNKKEESFTLVKKSNQYAWAKSFNFLHKEGFIAKNTSLEQFKSIFSSKKIINKVEWEGSVTSLKFFIEQLISNKEIIVTPPRKQKWELTYKCFFKALDGEEYPSRKYKDLKSPSDKIQKKINQAITLLK